MKPENAKSTITVADVNQRLDKILAPTNRQTGSATPTQSKGASVHTSHSMTAACCKLTMAQIGIFAFNRLPLHFCTCTARYETMLSLLYALHGPVHLRTSAQLQPVWNAGNSCAVKCKPMQGNRMVST